MGKGIHRISNHVLSKERGKSMNNVPQLTVQSDSPIRLSGEVEILTNLPSLFSVLPAIENAFSRVRLGVLLVDVKNFARLDALFCRETCSEILRIIWNVLEAEWVPFFGVRRILELCSLGSDDFLLFIAAPESMQHYSREHDMLQKHLEKQINQSLERLDLGQIINLNIGYAELWQRQGASTESTVYAAIKEATFTAKKHENSEILNRRRLFAQILKEERIDVVYQPIIQLKSANYFGFEALSRGPKGTMYESPVNLFHDAETFNCLYELEKLCHELAVKHAGPQLRDRYLFLNACPEILHASNHKRGRTRAILQEYGVDFSRVVLELTERTAIEDYNSFRETLNYYRNQGFLIAIDDAGAGYSSLQAIAELQPEFVKLDISLIHDINRDITKKALVETMIDFAYKINSQVIAEGIETNEELEILMDIGCNLAQGYLVGRPDQVIAAEPSQPVRDLITVTGNHWQSRIPAPATRIGDLVMYHPSISLDMPVNLVVDLFNQNKSIQGRVVCKAEHPVGLLMRERLFTMLGTRYGYDLFMHRLVNEVMEPCPLMLEWSVSVEEAARKVAERLDRGINDYLVVTRKEKYYGVVTISRLLETLAKLQIEQAKDANPLTGLPGNRSITRTIETALANNEPLGILYLDLDYFKTFNDRYGFEHGDQVLTMVAGAATQAVRAHGNPNDFVGHIGGDDFVVFTNLERIDRVAEEIIRIFDRQIRDFYTPEDLGKGEMIACDRQGREIRVPIISISVAGTVLLPGRFTNYLEVSETIAEVKKWCKQEVGSCYKLDRRQE